MIDFYKSSKRMKKRESILRRDKYICIDCKRYGKIKPASIVHHLTPLSCNNNLAFNNDNLISLCLSCHNKMHDRSNKDLLSSYGLSCQLYYSRKLRRSGGLDQAIPVKAAP